MLRRGFDWFFEYARIGVKANEATLQNELQPPKGDAEPHRHLLEFGGAITI